MKSEFKKRRSKKIPSRGLGLGIQIIFQLFLSRFFAVGWTILGSRTGGYCHYNHSKYQGKSLLHKHSKQSLNLTPMHISIQISLDHMLHNGDTGELLFAPPFNLDFLDPAIVLPPGKVYRPIFARGLKTTNSHCERS